MSKNWSLKETGLSYDQKFTQTIPDKCFEQSREIPKSWTVQEKFDVYFCMFFDWYCQSIIPGRMGRMGGMGTMLCLLPKLRFFQYFLIF